MSTRTRAAVATISTLAASFGLLSVAPSPATGGWVGAGAEQPATGLATPASSSSFRADLRSGTPSASKQLALAQSSTATRGMTAPDQMGTPPASEPSFEHLASAFAGHKAFTRPSKDVQIGFSIPSQVKEILATAGKVVRQGDLLIRGDDEEDAALLELQKIRAKSKASVDKQNAQLELANLEYSRLQEAEARGSANPQELDRARIAVAAATADLEVATVQQAQEELEVKRRQARVDRLRLTAPFDGVVDAVIVDLGQALQESEKVLRLVDIDPLWIDVDTPTDLTVRQKTKPGDPAWVLMDVAGIPTVVQAKVLEVAPTADASSRTRKVRVELANPKVGPDAATIETRQFVAGEPAWVRFAPPSEEWAKKAPGTKQ
jgi:RND family efflux transporter MFP subunit